MELAVAGQSLEVLEEVCLRAENSQTVGGQEGVSCLDQETIELVCVDQEHLRFEE